MSAPPRWRYEPLPPHQPACMGCWQAPATVAVWARLDAARWRWRAALCDACVREHRRVHRAVQGDVFEGEEDACWDEPGN